MNKIVTNLEIIENLYNAFAIEDVPNVLAPMHKDIIWNEAGIFCILTTIPISAHNRYWKATLLDALANGKASLQI